MLKQDRYGDVWLMVMVSAATHMQVIEKAVPAQKQQRAFTAKLKQELFDADPTCALCGNTIVGIEDAHVDHKIPFSLGGATEPSNAQLTHKFCNQSKGNRQGAL